MSIRPFRNIKRRKTKEIIVGKVKVGGNNPISVQSMTNTLTTDIKSTIKQINSSGKNWIRLSLTLLHKHGIRFKNKSNQAKEVGHCYLSGLQHRLPYCSL
mgnify:CR=1 FL=1